MTKNDETERDELAAAAVDLAFAARDEAPLPEHLAKKVTADADRHFSPFAGGRVRSRAQARAQMTTGAAGAQVIVMPLTDEERGAPAPRRGFDVVRWSGWLAAAAAVALLAGRSMREPSIRAASQGAPVVASADTVHASVVAGAVRGEIAWSAIAQSGVARFEGLTVNDPAASRYELWLRDGARDARYPVPVAVFDASPSGVAVVTLSPSLQVSQAAEIVVTREAPSGAVVSAREQVVLAAPLPGAAPAAKAP